MPEVIFPGPEGRLEGRFSPGPRPRAPVALILHSHPQAGGTMNNKIQGEADEVVTPGAVQKLVDKLRTQRHITIAHDTIPGANHFFANELDLLMKSVDDYLDYRLDPGCPIR